MTTLIHERHLRPVANGSHPPQDTPAAITPIPNLFDYRPEDGGILDAWLDLYGRLWLYAAGFEQWYTWIGTHWQPVEQYAIHAQIMALLDTMNQQARLFLKGKGKIQPQMEIKPYLTATRRTGGRVASIERMARALRFTEADSLDSAGLLNLTNGTVDLSNFRRQPHDPVDLLTYCLPYAYDPAAQASNWQKIMGRLDPHTAAFLQEFAGYALTTDTTHELALWLYGPPGGGKSTFLTGLQAMLGPKSGHLGLADIERNRFALANLPGKTLVVSSEQPGNFLNSTHTLNAIISGEPVIVDRKFKDAVPITPRCKLIWAMNDFPRVSDANNGIFRRVKVVEFPAVPDGERRRELKGAIAQEGAGILNWAIDGLKRLQARGSFDIPAAVKAATREFITQSDLPATFVAECCLTGPEHRAQSQQLYEAYQTWAIATGHKPKSMTSIAADWKRLGFERGESNGRVYWRGIGLREVSCVGVEGVEGYST